MLNKQTDSKNNRYKNIYYVIVVLVLSIVIKLFDKGKTNVKSERNDEKFSDSMLNNYREIKAKNDSNLKKLEDLKKSFDNAKFEKQSVKKDNIQDKSFFYSKKYPKAKGLIFKFKKPLGFEQLEGNRPNIVQKWEKERNDNLNYVSIILIVKNLDGDLNNVTTQEWTDYLKSERGRNYWTKDINNIRNSKFIVIDNYPGIYYEYSTIENVLDKSLVIYSANINLFVDGRLVSLQLLSPAENAWSYNLLEFKKLATTIVFEDQYN